MSGEERSTCGVDTQPSRWKDYVHHGSRRFMCTRTQALHLATTTLSILPNHGRDGFSDPTLQFAMSIRKAMTQKTRYGFHICTLRMLLSSPCDALSCFSSSMYSLVHSILICFSPIYA